METRYFIEMFGRDAMAADQPVRLITGGKSGDKDGNSYKARIPDGGLVLPSFTAFSGQFAAAGPRIDPANPLVAPPPIQEPSGARFTGVVDRSAGSVTFDIGLGDDHSVKTLKYFGRAIKIWRQVDGGGFVLVFEGVTEGNSFSPDQVTVAFRDLRFLLERDLLQPYKGTGGLEGGVDLKGVLKPYASGNFENIEPKLIDRANQIYQFDGYGDWAGTIDRVTDRLNDLFFGADHPDLASLIAATVGDGTYHTDLADRLIKLPEIPRGPLGVWSAGDPLTHAKLVERIALRVGLAAGRIDAASLSNFDTAVPGDVALYQTAQIKGSDMASQILAGVGGFWHFGADGKLKLAVLKRGAATGSVGGPNATHRIKDFQVQPSAAPFSRLRLGYRHNPTVYGSDLLQILTPAPEDPEVMLAASTYLHSDRSTGNLVTIPDHADFEMDGDQTLQFEVWFDVVDGTSQVIVGKRDPSVPNVGFQIQTNGADQKLVFVIDEGATQQLLFSDDVMVAGRWYDGAIRRTSATNLYEMIIGGTTQAETITSAVALGNPGDLSLLAGTFGSPLSGRLQNVRYWTALKTNATMIADRFKRLEGTEANLAGLWLHVSEGDGTIVANKGGVGSAGDGVISNLNAGVTWRGPVGDGIADETAPRFGALLVNGSFETGDFEGWTADSQIILVNDPTNAHQGNYVARVPTAAGTPDLFSAYIPVKTGDVIMATCYAKRDAASLPVSDCNLRFREYDGTKVAGTIGGAVAGSQAISTYQYLRTVYTVVDADAEFVRIDFDGGGGASGHWFTDEFSYSVLTRDIGDIGSFGGAVVDTLFVQGSSFNSTNRSHIVRLSGVDELNAFGLGFRLTLMKRSTHAFIDYRDDGTGTGVLGNSQLYNTHSVDADRLKLRDALSEIRTNANTTHSAGEFGEDVIIIITSEDSWRSNSANGDLMVAEMLLHGASNTIKQNATQRIPYLLIGIPNLGAGRGIEIITDDPSGTPKAQYEGLLVNGTLDQFGTLNPQDAEATLGADFFGNLTNAPTDGGTFRPLLLGGAQIFVEDGDSPVYEDTWQNPPLIWPSPGGLTIKNTLIGDVNQQIDIQNPTTSGFDVSARIVELSGVPTLQTETTAGESGQDFSKTKLVATIAWDDKYTIQYDLTVGKATGPPGEPEPTTVIIDFGYKDGAAGWVKMGSRIHSNNDQDNTKILLNQTKTFTVSGVAQNDDFGISKGTEVGDPSTLDGMDNFTYETATAPADAAATLTTTGDILLTIMGPDAGGLLP